MGVVSLVIALAALVFGLWSTFFPSQPPAPPAFSPEAILGGTAERVAKLEKDVGSLMLRLVTLEKELEAVKGKAGSVTRLTELSAKVAALQNRLDNMSLEQKMAALVSKKTAPAKTPPPKEQAKAKPAKDTKPKEVAKAQQRAKKKHTYVVRRGDTLFTVALRYKVRVKDLKKWNGLKTDSIKIGQKLMIFK